jgi:hypothetical protein
MSDGDGDLLPSVRNDGGQVILGHLRAMTDEIGLFEHAEYANPRPEHGYCTDDNARLLVVGSREADRGDAALLTRVALEFVIDAQVPDGRFHNRRDVTGAWTDAPSTDDCWGRALWGLGVAANRHESSTVRSAALEAFELGTRRRAPSPRAMAFAALGAADVLEGDPTHSRSRALLRDAVSVIGRPGPGAWMWPESRLTYANAVLAEALIVAGRGLGDPQPTERGIAMLEWLIGLQTHDGHLSVVSTAGADASTAGPHFDQQAIEVAAIADACWAAYRTTERGLFASTIAVAAAWFDGLNDAGLPMWDHRTGAGFDGLHAASVNLNQGAESTLACVSTMQRARSIDRLLG